MDEIITIPPAFFRRGAAFGCLPARFGWLVDCLPARCAHLAFFSELLVRNVRLPPPPQPHNFYCLTVHRRRESETFPSLLIYLTLVF